MDIIKLIELFFSFLQVGLFSVGGGYAAIPLIQEQMVEKHGWLSNTDFSALITIAEMTPGPIAINSATFVGIRVAGPIGAIVATIGCILPSIILVSLLFYLYYKYKELSVLQGILSSLRPAVVAFILGAGIKLLDMAVLHEKSIKFSNIDWMNLVIFGIAFGALRKFKLNPIMVLVASGVVGLLAGLLQKWLI